MCVCVRARVWHMDVSVLSSSTRTFNQRNIQSWCLCVSLCVHWSPESRKILQYRSLWMCHKSVRFIERIQGDSYIADPAKCIYWEIQINVIISFSLTCITVSDPATTTDPYAKHVRDDMFVRDAHIVYFIASLILFVIPASLKKKVDFTDGYGYRDCGSFRVQSCPFTEISRDRSSV